MPHGTILPIGDLGMTRRTELSARRKHQMVVSSPVRHVAVHTTPFRNRRMDHFERELFCEILVALGAERPGTFAQKSREARNMRTVASRAITVRRRRVGHSRGDLLSQIVMAGKADFLLVDFLRPADTDVEDQRHQESPHRQEGSKSRAHGCTPSVIS
jgi:hypothetical protein